MTLINVKAAPGVRVPYEDHPRRYITEAEAVSVERSAYVLRRLAEGDLLEAAAPAAPDAPAAAPSVIKPAAAAPAPVNAPDSKPEVSNGQS